MTWYKFVDVHYSALVQTSIPSGKITTLQKLKQMD